MSNYLQRQALRQKIIDASIHESLNLIVVIPAFDEPDIIGTLQSLLECDKTEQPAEVIVAINYGEQVDAALKVKSKQEFEKVNNWKNQHSTEQLKFHCILLNDLPKKHAGVGLARKIAMDEAVRRFEAISSNGILVCLDADCSVSKNYLTEIEQHYQQNPKCIAANVDFEHPIDNEHQDNPIILYELFLRYYIEGLRFANYHYPFHTIGSTITVKSKTYQKQGGMNKRKAGEDFYFLHKIFPLGEFGEICNAVVFTSGRTSHRVPFGTGRAILEWQEGKKDLSQTYDYKIFHLIKSLFNSIEKTFDIKDFEKLGFDTELKNYLRDINYQTIINEVFKNTTNKASFENRLKRYWDGFKVLKLVHYLRDEHFKNNDLIKMALALYEEKYGVSINSSNAFTILQAYRQAQKKRN